MLHISQCGRLRYHRGANVVDADDCRRVCEIETGIGGIEISDPTIGVEGVASLVKLFAGS